ncbi:outer membrane beta-barrel protein [Natronoflexus pectinivorans]|uniref:Outer membrane protein with beta-barrel domain n=1 Tax=Natronoflexus pectinivorans TaxID=682526 RepID=A0A4R2GIH2_9BACT|nr:outer membrane beta-barrel protein [Natronoflexus pectinivorans]TCO08367.1 outer membrane protein with beta-barrel domain [Natronoflexus pectinivorans]
MKQYNLPKDIYPDNVAKFHNCFNQDRVLLATKRRKPGVFSILTMLSIIIFVSTADAQNGQTDRQKVRDLVTVEETSHKTSVIFPGGSVIVDHIEDTITRLSVGRRELQIIEDDKSGCTRIKMVHRPREKFRGHWSGFDLGLNNFFSSSFDSSLPDDGYFMDLNNGKSVAVGLNFFQYDIGLSSYNNNTGLVTGLGITWHNYRLDSDYILTRLENGKTGYYIEEDLNIRKNKLTTMFLTVPLLLEHQFPVADSGKPIFISGGVYGAFRLRSHTKLVYDGREKEKSRDNLNLNSFKYGFTVRAGYRMIKLFATYDMTPLFQKDQGPELYPWSVGLTLVSF